MARADVVVLVVDAVEGAGDREGAIAGEAEEAGCGIVIAVNKWDLVKGQGQEFVKDFDERLRFQLKFLEFAPIVHLSALTGERTPKLLEVVDRVATARKKRVTTSRAQPVPGARHRRAPTGEQVRGARSASSTARRPARRRRRSCCSRTSRRSCTFPIERFLVNRLREEFGFEGTPIRLRPLRKRPRK